MVEVAGLEPTASASRTQRSTKLSHASICHKNVYYFRDILYSTAYLHFLSNVFSYPEGKQPEGCFSLPERDISEQ